MLPYSDFANPTGIAIMISITILTALGLVFVITRFIRKGRRLKVGLILFFLTLVLSPLHNWIIFMPINDHLLWRMKSMAETQGLTGRSPDEVRALFGDPTSGSLSEGYGDGTLRYKPLPFFLMGSQFEVHFVGNKVVEWEWAD